jgi:hypothetical protein
MWRLDLPEFLEPQMTTQKRPFDPTPFMDIIERAYLVDPDRTHSDLVYMGLHHLASRLKAEHTSGLLRQNVEAIRGLPSIFVAATKNPPDS